MFDFDGSLAAQVDTYVALLMRREKDFEIFFDHPLIKNVLEGMEDRIHLEQISPRAFEAAATRTLMILYEGQYSNILEPWRHYVPLKKDHSNFGDVVSTLRDLNKAAEIITRAYAEIACNPKDSYKTLVQEVDDVLMEACSRLGSPKSEPYTASEFYERWPFRPEPNPHQFAANRVERLIRLAQRIVPARYKALIKSALRIR